MAARSQPLNKIPCRDIEPHIRDSVRGDGNCLFRAFSKEVIGTESNHKAVHKAIVNFMTHKDIGTVSVETALLVAPLLHAFMSLHVLTV